MFTNIRKILRLLSAGQKKRAALVLALMIGVAVFETAGVASIMPFIAMLTQPDLIQSNESVGAVYEWLGMESERQFQVLLGLAFLAVFTTAIGLKIAFTWHQARFAEIVGYALSTRLVGDYLCQPYEWFLRQHSGDLGKNILSEVETVVTSGLKPAMEMAARSLVILMLAALLIAVDPVLAMFAGLGLILIYGLIYRSVRRLLVLWGQQRLEANRARYKAVSELIGGIKDLKVAGLEGVALRTFQKPARLMATFRTRNVAVQTIPSLALELVIVIGVVGYLLVAIGGAEDFRQSIPVLALFAFAVFRMKPAVQQAYLSYTQIRFSAPAVKEIVRSFDEMEPEPETLLSTKRATPLPVEREIRLEDVGYRYPDTQARALDGISLSIRARTTVGFVGATGAGKSTLVDVLTGLLKPEQGILSVDGTPIDTNNMRAWRRAIGYVPQQIYLADGSVAQNIAFGIPDTNIDPERVERAAKLANLHEFVQTELAEGYATTIGERGVRLSGGQRQRVGIARALYHDPQVLILDEATSALDNLTEKAVMHAVNSLSHQKTIILIAHRLTTVERCDCIHFLEHGRLVASGTYAQLVEGNQAFREIANAT